MPDPIPLNPVEIRSKRTLEVDLLNGKKMFIFTGNAIVDFKATESNAWTRATYAVNLVIPGTGSGTGNKFSLDGCTPYVSLSSVQSTQTDGNGALSGFAVDEFYIAGSSPYGTLPLNVEIAVQRRESMSVIYRIAYHVTIVGYYVPGEIPDPD